MMLQTFAALSLICAGTAAVDHSADTLTPYGLVTTEGTARLGDSVGFRITADGAGAARLPRRMLPAALALAVLDRPCPVEKCPWLKDPIVKPNPFTQFVQHILIISDAHGLTRIEYRNLQECAEARDAVLKQWRAQGHRVTAADSAICVPH